MSMSAPGLGSPQQRRRLHDLAGGVAALSTALDPSCCAMQRAGVPRNSMSDRVLGIDRALTGARLPLSARAVPKTRQQTNCAGQGSAFGQQSEKGVTGRRGLAWPLTIGCGMVLAGDELRYVSRT